MTSCRGHASFDAAVYGFVMDGTMSKRSSFMFALPSFWEGIARTFDLAGSYDEYNGLWEGSASDAAALNQDWWAVGDDLRDAIAVAGYRPRFRDPMT